MRGLTQRGGARRGTGWGLEDSLVFPPHLHHLLKHASFPAGSADLSSLSLAVSRTTGEQPSTVAARLHAQDGQRESYGGGLVHASIWGGAGGRGLRRSTSAFLSLCPSLPVEMGVPRCPYLPGDKELGKYN